MRLITYDGRTQNLRAWAREIGIGWCALQQRLAKGWPVEQALAAGKRELYKGKPALAPLARKAGVSARRPTAGRSAIQWRRFCSQVSCRIRPNTRSHSTARQRASPHGPMNSASPIRLSAIAFPAAGRSNGRCPGGGSRRSKLIHDPVVMMVVVPGIVHMPGIHIMPARLISPHWRRGWRRVYRTGRECLCPGLCRHCCADRRYTEHRGRSCCNHMLAHFQPPDVSFDDEMSISNTAHHNQGGTEPVARPLIQRYRQGASFRHSRVRRIRYPPGGRIHPMRPLPFSRQVTANRRFTDNRLSRARAARGRSVTQTCATDTHRLRTSLGFQHC
jgi:hypothetical protein